RHFIFTTALPPQVGAWWLDMLPRVQTDETSRRALHENALSFHQLLEHQGVQANCQGYIAAIVLGEDAVAVAAAEALQREGFDIRAIRPPTVPAGTARLRVSIHADHDLDTLRAAAEAISRVLVPLAG